MCDETPAEVVPVLLGFPDTTQDANLFPDKSPENGQAIVRALRDLGFTLTAEQESEIIRGKDFVQLKTGPFDIDLIFAPDGIERFAYAWQRASMSKAFPAAISTILSAAKKPPGGPRTWNRCRGWLLSASIGCKKTAILTSGWP